MQNAVMTVCPNQIKLSFLNDELMKPFLKWLFLIILITSCSDKDEQLIINNKDIVGISFAQNEDSSMVVHPFQYKDSIIACIPAHWSMDKLLISQNGKMFESYQDTNPSGIIMVKSKLPTIFIQTSSGTMDYVNEKKGNEESGTICIVDTMGCIEYSGELASIHGRGNYTWWQEKKPYSIKLGEKSKILGLKKAKKYNLLSQPDDYTGMRNWIALSAAKRLGIPCSISFDFANVYLNGNYAGCYLITNKVDIGKSGVNIHDLEAETEKLNNRPLNEYSQIVRKDGNRIMKAWDIPNNPSDITGGYLLEFDCRNEVLKSSHSVFQPKHGGNMMLKRPKCASLEQLEFIRNLWNQVEDALLDYSRGMNEEKLDSLIDFLSFVKCYLCNEVFMNLDAGTMSFFLYKEKDVDSFGKIIAAPIWDFDTSIGNPQAGLVGHDLRETIYAGAGVFPNDDSYNGVFGSLYKNREFRRKVRESFSLSKDTIADLFWGSSWESVFTYVENDMTIDNKRWHPNKNFYSECSQMRKWMSIRYAYLEKLWNQDAMDDACHVYLEIANNGFNHLLLYPVTKGEKFEVEMPSFNQHVQTKEGFVYEFAGWTIDGTRVNLDTLHVNRDIYIKAEWKTVEKPGLIQTLKNRWHTYKWNHSL